MIWICSGCEVEGNGGQTVGSGWCAPPRGWLIGADDFAGYGVCSEACALRTERRVTRRRREAKARRNA